MTEGYKPQLDGLRALAVAAVVWSHWERKYQFGIPFGVGVHLFYVLSGFLITGILLRLRDLEQKGVALRAFYIRRALRIFPAFYATLVLAWLVDSSAHDDILRWHATYLTNVLVFMRGEWVGALSHFWSLAVEEQFYLLWPWVIVFAPRRFLIPSVVVATLAAPLWRYALALAGYDEALQGVLMIGSLDSLGIGALLAVVPLNPRALLWCGVMPRMALWAAESIGVTLPASLMVTKQVFQAMLFGWLVLGAAAGFKGVAGRVLAAAPVVYLGRISYGVYLIHGPIGYVPIALFRELGLTWPVPEPWRFVVLAALTLGLAAASWHFMERPINRLKRRFPYEGRAAAAARGGSPRLSPAGIEP